MQVVGKSCGGCDMELESIMICEVCLKEVVEPCSQVVLNYVYRMSS